MDVSTAHDYEDVGMSNDEVMSRRGFFKRSFSKVTSVGSDYVEHKVVEQAKSWIRPPFAQTELDFLLNCSRCGDCIDACPHNVIFPLPLSRGASVAGTPAMDIPNNACLLCTDWACVTVCDDKALSFVSTLITGNKSTGNQIADKTKGFVDEQSTSFNAGEEGSTELIGTESLEMPQAKDCPPMASARIDESQCMPYSGPECGACRGSCPIPNTLIWHNEKPSINLESCIGCGQCIQSCITSPKAITISQYQPLVDKMLQAEAEGS